MFFIMGGPMLGAQDTCRKLGIRMIDVRHEQAAAMMANAYARLTGKAGLCSTASGPAATNLLTGLAHALDGCCPHHCPWGCQSDSSFSYRSLSGSRSAQYDASRLEMGRAGD